ncbi:MAG: M15 family metallopeptidase [Oscillospiraceae bacterium]
MSSKKSKERTMKEKLQRSLPIVIMVFVLIVVILVTVVTCLKAIGGTSDKKVTPEQPLVIHPVTTEATTTTETTTTQVTTTKVSTKGKPKVTFAFLAATTATTSATTTMSLPARMVAGMELSFYQAIMNVEDEPIFPVAFMTPDDALDIRIKMESSDENVASITEDNQIKPVGAGNCVIHVSSVANPYVTAEILITVNEKEDSLTTPEFSSPSQTTYTMAIPAPEEEGQEVPQPERDDIIVINGVTYVKGIMIANKTYPLPESYNPAGMTPDTADAFKRLQQAAKDEAGLKLSSHSDYRSYRTQAIVYEGYCGRDGQEAADRYSARAGYSEHQTGMVIDVNNPSYSFNGTPEAEWLAENAWKYGFIVRYPKDKENFTGYQYESWHIRYVGEEWAKEIYDSGLSLEEYLNIHSQYP